MRFVRPKEVSTSTAADDDVEDTTPFALPDDMATDDPEPIVDASESGERKGSAAASASNQRQTRYTDYNPYAWNAGEHESQAADHGQEKHERHRPRRVSGHHRVDRRHQEHRQAKRDVRRSGGVYLIRSKRALKRLHADLQAIMAGGDANTTSEAKRKPDSLARYSIFWAMHRDRVPCRTKRMKAGRTDLDGVKQENGTFGNSNDDGDEIALQRTHGPSETLRRTKRKSGKAAGALSRPKGASESGSKSSSRKKDRK